jgi:hypothetical protein
LFNFVFLKCSSDIAQAGMENILSVIDAAAMYFDDIGAFSSSCEHHICSSAQFPIL